MTTRATADSGRWAIEVADEYPRATVIGLDLSPMQPDNIPENCEFIIGDLTESLADFDDGTFDLVHSRSPSPLIRFPTPLGFKQFPEL
jgi:hypothetical protein